MPAYQAVPHKIYPGAIGEIMHFDMTTLAFTELSPLHQEVLTMFETSRTPDAVRTKYGASDAVDFVINELIALGLVAQRQPPQPKKVFALRPNVRAFRIALTEECNLRCVECFVTKTPEKLRRMSPETLERVIHETIPYGAKDQVTYHFFGGEPLLRFDHIKRAVEITEAAVAQGVMVPPFYTITTNATLIDHEIIAFFVKHHFRVGVSIDGPKEMNDKLRIYIDGRGSFDQIKANFMRLHEAGIDPHMLITPHPDHLDSLADTFRRVLEEFPMRTVTVNTPLHFDTVQWTVPGERYALVLLELMRIAKRFGVTVDSGASPPLAAIGGNINREGPCALICDTVMASVGPDGSMSYCSQKWHPRITVPITADTTLQTPIRRATDCLTCEAHGICGGPCPAFQEIAGVELDGNKCDFMRTLVREVPRNLDLFEQQ